jgi:hypothetical protein
LATSGLFKACSVLIQTYHSQQSIYCQKAVAISFLLLIWATPSKFFMRLPWDSERPAGFDLVSLKERKACHSCIQQTERLADHLDASLPSKVLE